MKGTTTLKSMLDFSTTLTSLKQKKTPIVADTADPLRDWWLGGNSFYFDNWTRFYDADCVRRAAGLHADNLMKKLEDAGMIVPKQAASELVQWFSSGAVWAFEHRSLEIESSTPSRPD